MKDQTENVIVKLSFQFALDVVEFAEQLDEKRKYVVAKQILKSGTSIGANVREAQGAESRNDFIHKLKISYKEAEEQNTGWTFAGNPKNYPDSEKLSADVVVLKKILAKIIVSMKRNQLS